MGPREEVGRRQQQRQRRDQDRTRGIEMRAQQMQEDRDCRADCDRRQDHGPSPIAVVDQRVNHLRQPRTRDPGFTVMGEREYVGRGHRAVVDDPLSDPDLPHRIGIAQQDLAGREIEQIGAHGGAQRHQSTHGATAAHVAGDGK